MPAPLNTATAIASPSAPPSYLPDPHASIARFTGVIVLTLEGDKISALTRFGDSAILLHFGLPRTLPAASRVSSSE